MKTTSKNTANASGNANKSNLESGKNAGGKATDTKNQYRKESPAASTGKFANEKQEQNQRKGNFA